MELCLANANWPASNQFYLQYFVSSFNYSVPLEAHKFQNIKTLVINNNVLPNELEGCTGEYWPKVSTARSKMTEGQYSPVQPD